MASLFYGVSRIQFHSNHFWKCYCRSWRYVIRVFDLLLRMVSVLLLLWKFYINVSTASYWVRNLSVSWWQYSINCMPEVTDDTDWMVTVNIEGWAWIMHTRVCLWQSKLNQSTYIRRLPCVLCPSYANAIDLVILLNWYNNGWVKYSLLHQATALNSSNSRGCCRAARESDTFIRVSITGTF